MPTPDWIPPLEEWITLDEAAARIGVSRTTVRNCIERRRLTSLHRIGDFLLVLSAEEVEEFAPKYWTELAERRRELAKEKDRIRGVPLGKTRRIRNESTVRLGEALLDVSHTNPTVNPRPAISVPDKWLKLLSPEDQETLTEDV